MMTDCERTLFQTRLQVGRHRTCIFKVVGFILFFFTQLHKNDFIENRSKANIFRKSGLQISAQQSGHQFPLWAGP